MVEAYYLLRILPYNWSFLKPLAASFAAASVTYLLTRWLTPEHPFFQLVLGVFILWGTYAFIIFLLKISEEDRLVLERILHRFNLKKSTDTRFTQ